MVNAIYENGIWKYITVVWINASEPERLLPQRIEQV